ncbi:MAG: hypothetical protein V9G10_12040 [Candidatus Nanopelagicales bacterium]
MSTMSQYLCHDYSQSEREPLATQRHSEGAEQHGSQEDKLTAVYGTEGGSGF